MKYTRTSALITLAVVASSLGACKGRDTGATMDSAAGRVDSAGRTTTAAVNDSARRADSLKSTARSGWTEPSIYGFASAADNGEILMGQLGQKKATNPKVKAFAREMVTEHRALAAETKSLFAKISATADTAANDAHDLANHVRDEIKDLTDKKAGADWDKDYIDKMIDDHQKVLDKLQDAAKNNTDSTVTGALSKTTAKVQEHLTKAQSIKSGLDNMK
jgi:putative membrane protein